jgi:hypothetical protein
MSAWEREYRHHPDYELLKKYRYATTSVLTERLKQLGCPIPHSRTDKIKKIEEMECELNG